MSTLNIGITGASGSLGKRLLRHLLNKHKDETNIRIHCLVRNPESIKSVASEGCNIVEGDLHNTQVLQTFVNNLDVCVHLASLVGFATTKDYHHTNVLGTENLCAAIAGVNPECRLIYCSSITVLRRNKIFPWFNTAYANSKHAGELIVNEYQRQFKLCVNFIYPGLIYGPGDTHLLPNLKRHLKKGSMFFITGGEVNAPLIYIDDLCELFSYAIFHRLENGKKLIGVGPQDVGIHRFIAMVATELGLSSPKVTLPKCIVSPTAIVLECIYRLLGKKNAPPISKRAVNFLSGQLDPKFVASTNGQEWTGKTRISEGLKLTLSDPLTNQSL